MARTRFLRGSLTSATTISRVNAEADMPYLAKFRVSYRTNLLGHLTPKRAAFSGADTSRMNLRGQGTTGKSNFFSVNAILTEICKYLTFIFRIAHLPTPLHTLLLSLIVPNRTHNPRKGRGN